MTTFELIAGNVNVEQVRRLAAIQDDELLQALFAYLLCETAGGLELPTKSHRTAVARHAMEAGVEHAQICEVLKISRKTLKRMAQ